MSGRYILSQQINKLCHNAIKIFIIAGLVSITSESHAQQWQIIPPSSYYAINNLCAQYSCSEADICVATKISSYFHANYN